MTYNYRFLARIIIEAATPIVIKSGEKNILTDAVVLRDVNGLPYIPGTSIAGVVRHAWIDAGNDDYKDIFGYQEKKEGKGSRIIFSEGRILDSQGIVVDGLHDEIVDSLLKEYKQLPIRQHVRITEKGVAKDTGKYDEEIVYKGTRFCFEMEMIGKNDDGERFDELLKILQNQTFRLGSGTRSGFGEIKVVKCQKRSLCLSEQLDCYLSKSSNLEDNKVWYDEANSVEGKVIENKSWTKYELNLEPEDFFLFGSGFGDEEADMTPVKENVVTWENGHAKLKEGCYLCPATSIKGAIAHRVAFHYNRMKGDRFADKMIVEDREKYLGKNNEAVKLLFGSEGDEKGNGKLRGNVIVSDLYIDKVTEKILNHVAIDRFTGGAIDGALFSEKTVYGSNKELKIDILANMENMDIDVVKAFKLTLDDICKGMLPLGGGVNRGHGIFKGKIKENGRQICVER